MEKLQSGEGFKTVVLPVTTALIVIPAIIANGKFHGGIIAPTPSGTYSNEFFSGNGEGVTGCSSAQRIISRP